MSFNLEISRSIALISSFICVSDASCDFLLVKALALLASKLAHPDLSLCAHYVWKTAAVPPSFEGLAKAGHS